MRAVGPRVAGPAVAFVGAFGVTADAIVADVGAGRTLVHVLRAVHAGEAGRAGAIVLAYQVPAGGAVATRLRRALVNVLSAGLALEALGTATLVALHQVHAEVVGLTGNVYTVVYVDLAVWASVTGQAGAGQLQRGAAFLTLLYTGGTVETGTRGTGIIGRLTTQAHLPEKWATF
jgi:hypothetical protein